jgi:hypothetical protein
VAQLVSCDTRCVADHERRTSARVRPHP